MVFAMELQTAGVYVSLQPYGLLQMSKPVIRDRKIALNEENGIMTLLAKIEADPPKSTAAVNKWWEILCDSAS